MNETIWTQTWEILAIGMIGVFIFLCALVIGLKFLANWSECKEDEQRKELRK